MKNSIITICLVLGTFASAIAQKEKQFFLGPELVKVYSLEANTKGSHFEYEFEDDYTVKLTNRVYKINLFITEDKMEIAQNTISQFLDGEDATSGYENMIWKRTSASGKSMYKVELKNNKLYIQVDRKQMDTEAYNTLNSMGKAFLNKINS